MNDGTTAPPPVERRVIGALYDHTIFGGRLRVVAFGRFYYSFDQGEDWTFNSLRTPKDAKEKESSLAKYLPRIAKELGIRSLLVPSTVDSNAKICWENELGVRIPVGNHLAVRRGVNADGCRIRLGQAWAMSASGGAAIAACYPFDPHSDEKVRITGAYGGLQSLIDEQEALTGLPSRHPQSVTENILTSMGCSGERKYRRKRVGVTIILPTPSSEFMHPWEDPVVGDTNRKRSLYIAEKFGKSCLPGDDKDGRVELHELITLQFTELGVPLENIRLVRARDLFSKTVVPGKGEVWYSTRGPFPQRRNLIIFKHIKPAPPPK